MTVLRGTSYLLTDDYFFLSLPQEVILVGRLEVLCSGFQGGRLSNCLGDFQAVLVNAGCKSVCTNALSLGCRQSFMIVLVRMSKCAIRLSGGGTPELALYCSFVLTEG